MYRSRQQPDYLQRGLNIYSALSTFDNDRRKRQEEDALRQQQDQFREGYGLMARGEAGREDLYGMGYDPFLVDAAYDQQSARRETFSQRDSQEKERKAEEDMYAQIAELQAQGEVHPVTLISKLNPGENDPIAWRKVQARVVEEMSRREKSSVLIQQATNERLLTEWNTVQAGFESGVPELAAEAINRANVPFVTEVVGDKLRIGVRDPVGNNGSDEVNWLNDGKPMVMDQAWSMAQGHLGSGHLLAQVLETQKINLALAKDEHILVKDGKAYRAQIQLSPKGVTEYNIAVPGQGEVTLTEHEAQQAGYTPQSLWKAQSELDKFGLDMRKKREELEGGKASGDGKPLSPTVLNSVRKTFAERLTTPGMSPTPQQARLVDEATAMVDALVLQGHPLSAAQTEVSSLLMAVASPVEVIEQELAAQYEAQGMSGKGFFSKNEAGKRAKQEAREFKQGMQAQWNAMVSTYLRPGGEDAGSGSGAGGVSQGDVAQTWMDEVAREGVAQGAPKGGERAAARGAGEQQSRDQGSVDAPPAPPVGEPHAQALAHDQGTVQSVDGYQEWRLDLFFENGLKDNPVLAREISPELWASMSIEDKYRIAQNYNLLPNVNPLRAVRNAARDAYPEMKEQRRIEGLRNMPRSGYGL